MWFLTFKSKIEPVSTESARDLWLVFTPNCDILQAKCDPDLQIQALYLLVRCLVNLSHARDGFSRIIVCWHLVIVCCMMQRVQGSV